MRILKISIVMACLIPIAASAEYCWMLGCKGDEGYVRVERNQSGQYLPFCGTALPTVGDEAALCAFAYLRGEAVAGALGKETNDWEIGSLMGQGSKLKILKRIESQGKVFVEVKVLSDDSGCRDKSDKCSFEHY
jgi:hypothetical protein